MSVNKVILVGNLGSDPEVRQVSDSTVCNFSLATNKVWKGKDGQKQEKVTWHRIVVWGPQAESCGKFLAKGRQVYLEGEIENRTYEDKEGNTRYVSEVNARNVQFLAKKEGGGDGGSNQGGGGNYEPPPDFGGAPDNDIPF